MHLLFALRKHPAYLSGLQYIHIINLINCMQNIQASQKVVQFHCKITDAANPIPDVMPDMPCIMNP